MSINPELDVDIKRIVDAEKFIIRKRTEAFAQANLLRSDLSNVDEVILLHDELSKQLESLPSALEKVDLFLSERYIDLVKDLNLCFVKDANKIEELENARSQFSELHDALKVLGLCGDELPRRGNTSIHFSATSDADNYESDIKYHPYIVGTRNRRLLRFELPNLDEQESSDETEGSDKPTAKKIVTVSKRMVFVAESGSVELYLAEKNLPARVEGNEGNEAITAMIESEAPWIHPVDTLYYMSVDTVDASS